MNPSEGESPNWRPYLFGALGGVLGTLLLVKVVQVSVVDLFALVLGAVAVTIAVVSHLDTREIRGAVADLHLEFFRRLLEQGNLQVTVPKSGTL